MNETRALPPDETNRTIVVTSTQLRFGGCASSSCTTRVPALGDALSMRYRAITSRVDRGSYEAARAFGAVVVGRLALVTVVIKDLIATYGAETTADSLSHDLGSYANRDTPAAERLPVAEALAIDKTSVVEHAIGRTDPARPFLVPRNLWDSFRWPDMPCFDLPITVALVLADFMLGICSTGSVCILVAFYGLTGPTTTAGLVMTEGCLPVSPSLDRIGPLARCARDCVAVLVVISAAPSRENSEPNLQGKRPPSGASISALYMTLKERGGRVALEVAVVFGTVIEILSGFGVCITPFGWPGRGSFELAAMTIACWGLDERNELVLGSCLRDYCRLFRLLAVLVVTIPLRTRVRPGATLHHPATSVTVRMADFGAIALVSVTALRRAAIAVPSVRLEHSEGKLTRSADCALVLPRLMARWCYEGPKCPALLSGCDAHRRANVMVEDRFGSLGLGAPEEGKVINSIKIYAPTATSLFVRMPAVRFVIRPVNCSRFEVDRKIWLREIKSKVLSLRRHQLRCRRMKSSHQGLLY